MVIYRDFKYWPDHDKIRRLHIYLPKGYNRNKQRYPVLYMWDGHNLFYNKDATYGKSWGLKKFMDNWDLPLIIVGMECSHEGDNRLNEYCPYRRRMWNHQLTGLGVDTYRWLVEDVKPYIDSQFRTLPEREHTGIAGSSMGGIMALYGVMAHNDVFSKAACVSVGVRHGVTDFEKTLANSSIDPDTRVYLSWGEREADQLKAPADPARDSQEAKANFWMAQQLQDRGAKTYVYFQKDGEHCEACWEKQDPLFMNFLWK